MKRIEEIRINVSPEMLVEADLLIAWAIQRDRSYILAHPEHVLNFWQTRKILRCIKQIKKGVPLAYITGQKEFYGLNFLVNKYTLIPRPDTEIMVEEALAIIKNSNHNFLLIDVGTGSGCVAISIAKNFSAGNIIASDISRKALRVARKNAKLNGTRIDFYHGDLLKPIIKTRHISIPNHLIVTANLPYLTKAWAKQEQSLKYEPKNALIADTVSGLTIYGKLFEQIKLLSGNFNLNVLIEVDPRQAAEAIKLAQKYFANAKLQIKKDLAGRDRLLIISTTVNS